MNRIKCFLIEWTRRSRYTLRRYSASECSIKCPGGGYHNAHSPVIAETEDDPTKDYYCSNPPPRPSDDDPTWPAKCERCDYHFTDADHRQVFGEPLYKRSDSGEIYTLRDAPAGAMWDAEWWPELGPDGKRPVVRLPDGYDWMIDGKANNCSCPPDNPNHRCWTRSGEMPTLTASPSILTPGYHGFLRNGFLESC